MMNGNKFERVTTVNIPVEAANHAASVIAGTMIVLPAVVGRIEVSECVEHQRLQEVIQNRCEQGHLLLRMLDCRPKNDLDFVTLVWGVPA